jgi:hypothetical protein
MNESGYIRNLSVIRSAVKIMCLQDWGYAPTSCEKRYVHAQLLGSFVLKIRMLFANGTLFHLTCSDRFDNLQACVNTSISMAAEQMWHK